MALLEKEDFFERKPARAFCMSDHCITRRFNNIKVKDPGLKLEKRVPFHQVDCPDCGHVLVWSQGERIRRTESAARAKKYGREKHER